MYILLKQKKRENTKETAFARKFALKNHKYMEFSPKTCFKLHTIKTDFILMSLF